MIDPISSGAVFSILRNIQIQSAHIAQSSERLSSGFRINHASDDPAGIFMVQSFLSQIGGLDSAARNNQIGISMLQSGEAGLSGIQDLVSDIKTQSIAAQNGSLSTEQLQAIQQQVTSDFNGINSILSDTTFNGQLLLQGGSVTIQTGPNAGQTTTLNLPDATSNGPNGILSNGAGQSDLANMEAAFVGVMNPTPASIAAAAANLQTAATSAFDLVGVQVSSLAGGENALSAQVSVLNTTSDATQGALSVIRDADIAAEAVKLSRAQLLQQAGFAVLSMFNLQGSQVLKLLSPG
ncbi:MAG TPA: flagellin [Chloroflexota bacterium]